MDAAGGRRECAQFGDRQEGSELSNFHSDKDRCPPANAGGTDKIGYQRLQAVINVGYCNNKIF
jgi:hypothetical protein